MAWTYNTKVIREGRSWTNDDGIKHPSNWGSWSDEEKTTAGLVWVDDPAPFDLRFYWAADVPKALDDPIHAAQERRLPAAGRADDRDELTFANGQRDVTNCLGAVWERHAYVLE